MLGPLLFFAYVNDIAKNIESNIRLFADDCVIYRNISAKEDMTKLQSDMVRLGEWSVENGIKINPRENKVICFTRARTKVPLNYYLLGLLVPEVSSCKYLGIILCSDLSWVDQVKIIKISSPFLDIASFKSYIVSLM